MKVLPTPTGPMIMTLWPASTKRSEHSSSQTARSKLTLVSSSQFSSTMSGSRPAARARRAAEEVSRRVTSSASTSSRNSAWPMLRALARARRSGRVSRQRPSFTARSTVLSSGEMTGGGALTTTLPLWSPLRPDQGPRRALGPRAELGERRKSPSGRAKRAESRRPWIGTGSAWLLGAALEHATDQADAVGLGFGGTGTAPPRRGLGPTS